MKKIACWLMILVFCYGIPLFAQDEDFSNIIFLHHSTGGNLINQGAVRSLIAAYNTQFGANLEFWDHGYNGDGVHDQNGNYYNNYNIPNDNTDPIGLYNLFMLPVHNPPDNALSRFLLPHPMGADTVTHDVIIFKSCFPASDISSEQMLTDYQNWYLAIRNIMDAHPEKIFIPMTPPPLVRSATTPENAARAQRFADWLMSPEYSWAHLNICVFDFRHYLMEHDPTSIYYNCLREAYGGAGGDSHPNLLANQTVGPIFVNHITNAIEYYHNNRYFFDGDLNCNQIPYDLSDIELVLAILEDRAGVPVDSCVMANSDVDHDGMSFAVGDITHIINKSEGIVFPDLSPSLSQDSLIMTPADGYPGDTLEVQLYLSMADSLLGFQVACSLTSDYFEILDFTQNPQFLGPLFVNIDSNRFSLDCVMYAYSHDYYDYLRSGRYFIGSLSIAISADAPVEAIAQLDYFSDNQTAIYNGISICSDLRPFQSLPIMIESQLRVLPDFYSGDANADNAVNGLDVTYLVNYFRGGQPIPPPILRADANGSCAANGLDVVYLVNYFKGGQAPLRGNCP